MIMVQSIKKRVENTAYLEKNDMNEFIHELITGGHRFLFQKWIIIYKKLAIEWRNLYPKLQKRERNVKRERKKETYHKEHA